MWSTRKTTCEFVLNLYIVLENVLYDLKMWHNVEKSHTIFYYMGFSVENVILCDLLCFKPAFFLNPEVKPNEFILKVKHPLQ